MNTDRIQHRLGVETSKNSVNTDTYLKINLDGEQRILPPDIINELVNVGERFNTERQRSPFYRVLGTFNPTITNALFNLDDSLFLDKYTWKGFNYKDPSTLEYRFDDPVYPNVVKRHLKEKDGWFGYFDPDISNSGLCNYFDMEPKRQRFSFTPDIDPYNAPNIPPVKNWELTITYPASIDSGHTMVNNGLLIIDATPAVVSTRTMTAFGMPCLHNLNVGDIVRISGATGYNGDHVVVRTGLDNGDLKPYYFVLDLPPTGTITALSRMKRMFGGVESTYYFRKFRKIQTRNTPIIEQDDYETYNLAFSENYYYDNISQFVFNEDINVSGLTDNLGRPLSQLYLTVIKTDSNGIFTNVSSGIETPYIPILNTSSTTLHLLNVPAINRIHNGGYTTGSLPFPSHVPLETNVTFTNSNVDFYGDLVDYNPNQLKETVLADVSHRFNTINRESSPNMTYVVNLGTNLPNLTPPTTATVSLGPRQEGYFYKAHHLITIREFSTYVEQGDQYTVGVPDYAVDLGDGTYLWRDLLDIGFNESNAKALDYPFLNGCHYMYDNYCFTVRRQDPFDNWDLYYSKYPADPIGERMTTKFNSNSAEDVC
jgi:hypothetical protein